MDINFSPRGHKISAYFVVLQSKNAEPSGYLV
jgi:hypothetical protein